MQLDRYDFIEGPGNTFEFYSFGPNGLIKKLVQYQLIDDKRNIYNLAFGDWDATKNRINDKAISNNSDREKILATVAATTIVFTTRHPDAIIIAVGSTAVRNRLYQMNIAIFLEEIQQLLHIEGYINGKWEVFRKSRNYNGFLATTKSKKLNFD